MALHSEIGWDTVLAVEVYKIDLVTTDCICLAYQTSDGWREINETSDDWEESLDAFESNLPGFPLREKWLHKVTFPAFEPNHKRLWTRSEEAE